MPMDHSLNEKLPRNTRDLYEMWVDFANITNGLRVHTVCKRHTGIKEKLL